jgi:hypothetical protein
MRVFSPAGITIIIALLVTSFLLRPDPEAIREQSRLDARATAQAHRAIAIAATATARARHCATLERVAVSAQLRPPPGRSDLWYYATGTVRNTCNYPLRLRLDADGFSPGREESVAAVRLEMHLAAHEERHFVEVLTQFREGYIDRLVIQPRIWSEDAGGKAVFDSYRR